MASMRPFSTFLHFFDLLCYCVSWRRRQVGFQVPSKWETVPKGDAEGLAGQLWSTSFEGFGTDSFS